MDFLTKGFQILQELPRETGFPVAESGHILAPAPELYLSQNTLLRYDASTSDLMAVGKEGDILLATKIVRALPDAMKPKAEVDAPYEMKTLRLRSLNNPYSGLVMYRDNIWMLPRNYCAGVLGEDGKKLPVDDHTAIKVLNLIGVFSPSKAAFSERFYHPLCEKSIMLLAVNQTHLVLFEQDEGSELYRVPHKELTPIKRLLF